MDQRVIEQKLESLRRCITAEVMKKAVGFRNIAVHNYEKINWAIVFSICTKQIDDFKQFAREINTYISDS